MTKKTDNSKALSTTTKKTKVSHHSNDEKRGAPALKLSKDENPKHKIFHIDRAFSLIAIILSMIALWQSFIAQSRTSSPNVQGQAAKVTSLNWSSDNRVFELRGMVTIINFGNAEVQIISIIPKPILGEETANSTQFAISDTAFESFDPNHRSLINRTIPPNESKDIFFYFSARRPYNKSDMGLSVNEFMFGIKLAILFSNGIELSIIPEFDENVSIFINPTSTSKP